MCECTLTHFFCWQPPLPPNYLFCSLPFASESECEPSRSHYVLARSSLVLCLPDFKNDLPQPHSIRPPLHPLQTILFTLLFCSHLDSCRIAGPLKIGLQHLGDHSGGSGGCCFSPLSNDAFCLLPFSPGIWDRRRGRTWRGRWEPWTRVCDSSSSWLRRECCSGGRSRYAAGINNMKDLQQKAAEKSIGSPFVHVALNVLLFVCLGAAHNVLWSYTFLQEHPKP